MLYTVWAQLHAKPHHASRMPQTMMHKTLCLETSNPCKITCARHASQAPIHALPQPWQRCAVGGLRGTQHGHTGNALPTSHSSVGAGAACLRGRAACLLRHFQHLGQCQQAAVALAQRGVRDAVQPLGPTAQLSAPSTRPCAIVLAAPQRRHPERTGCKDRLAKISLFA